MSALFLADLRFYWGVLTRSAVFWGDCFIGETIIGLTPFFWSSLNLTSLILFFKLLPLLVLVWGLWLRELVEDSRLFLLL